MDIQEQIQLRFFGVDIIKTNFSSQEIYSDNVDNPISLEIIPKVFYPDNEKKHFKILMDVEVEVENYFKLHILGIGSFETNQELTEEIKEQFVNTNAPAIMFPYIRSFISSFSSNLGNVTGTLTIPPYFFGDELDELNELKDTYEDIV